MMDKNNQDALSLEDVSEESQVIRSMDVLCGRGKVDHVGNTCFRQAVAERLEDYKRYQEVKDRLGMSLVVQSIVDSVHNAGGRFIDQNWKGVWVELNAKDRRQKVDRACRDAKKNSAAAAAAAAANATQKASVRVVSNGSTIAAASSRPTQAVSNQPTMHAMLPPKPKSVSPPMSRGAVNDPSPLVSYGMGNPHQLPPNPVPSAGTFQQPPQQQMMNQLPPNQGQQQVMLDDNYANQYRGYASQAETDRYPIQSQNENPPQELSYDSRFVAPQLEYSCGSMAYDCSGLDFRADSDSRSRWNAVMANPDFNKSAVSAMDFSAISLDLYTALSDDEKSGGNVPVSAPPTGNSIVLDSVGASMDLGGCFRPDASSRITAQYADNLSKDSVSPVMVDTSSSNATATDNGNGELAFTDLDRQSRLQREESAVTVVTGARSRVQRECVRVSEVSNDVAKEEEVESEESFADSFNMSLDLSALPRPLAARRETRRDAFRAKHCSGNDSTTLQLPANKSSQSAAGNQSDDSLFDAIEPTSLQVQAGSMQHANSSKSTYDSNSTPDESLLGSVASFVSVPSVG